jgi:hypothetical protein
MEIVHDVLTLSIIHGQLSMDNRCPWPIVHETNKTRNFFEDFEIFEHFEILKYSILGFLHRHDV